MIDEKCISLGIFHKNKFYEAVAARRAAEMKYFGKYRCCG
jgi:hypothetical protein